MPIKDGKEWTFGPSVTFLLLWLLYVENNTNSIFIIISYNSLVCVCCVTFDHTVLFHWVFCALKVWQLYMRNLHWQGWLAFCAIYTGCLNSSDTDPSCFLILVPHSCSQMKSWFNDWLLNGRWSGWSWPTSLLTTTTRKVVDCCWCVLGINQIGFIILTARARVRRSCILDGPW